MPRIAAFRIATTTTPTTATTISVFAWLVPFSFQHNDGVEKQVENRLLPRSRSFGTKMSGRVPPRKPESVFLRSKTESPGFFVKMK